MKKTRSARGLPAVAACCLAVTLPLWPEAQAETAKPAPAPPLTAAQAPAQEEATPFVDKKRARFNVDRKILESRQVRAKGEWARAQTLMLEAAAALQQLGYENDQAKMLREMTLEPVDDKPEAARKYVEAGKRALAEFYYRRYLAVKPRDAQWLLEALAWANYAGAEDLLKRFSARVPDKAHENIEERARLHAKELQLDDALFIAFERLRFDRQQTYSPTLKDWPWPVDQTHSQLGTTLLHMAVWFNRPEAVRILVEERKANVNVADLEKDTPLDYALHLGNTELAAYLKSKGGKANRKHTPPAADPAKAADSAKAANAPAAPATAPAPAPAPGKQP